jgi:hypothetical protein
VIGAENVARPVDEVEMGLGIGHWPPGVAGVFTDSTRLAWWI